MMQVYKPYIELLQQNHILIAGATGSGKSVLINGLIDSLISAYSPQQKSLVLVDLKKVELIDYKANKHTSAYISELNQVQPLFKNLVAVMRERYSRMQQQHIKRYKNGDIYVFIDEYADITLNCKAAVNDIALLATQGRAAGIHLIIATQRPTSDIVTPLIKCNCDCKIALRTVTPQESRNIISTADAVNLPRYGKALVLIPGYNLQLIDIPIKATRP